MVFSINIALRMLLYLAATYKEYAEEYKLNLYGMVSVMIPRPEFTPVTAWMCRTRCGFRTCMRGRELRMWKCRCYVETGLGTLLTSMSDSARYRARSGRNTGVAGKL